jgi:hypothetical protein
MNGFQHLPSQQDQRFWVYTGNKNSTGFQTWLKPPGINFVHIITIGAGGGGSSAAIWQTGVARTGGGGGGSGGMTSAFLPAYLIPDTVYINVGIGGAGGASTNTITANAGVAGTATYAGYYPVQTAGYILCVAAGGVGGTAGGIGGAAGAALTTTSLPISQIGIRTYIAGQAGTSGGNAGAGATTATYRITGGGGGSGNNAANAVGSGSSVSMAGEYFSAILPSPAGTNGVKVEDLIRFISAGGPGASSSTTISGSNGGWGGFGSGGGGGSVGPGLGGAGGNGGDGLVIITCG